MSPRQPVVSGERLIKALRKDGWEVVRQRGSHVRLKKVGRRHALVVPLHREIRRGTLVGILRDADLEHRGSRSASRVALKSRQLLMHSAHGIDSAPVTEPSSKFSAAGPALGYLAQVDYALLAALERMDDEDDFALSLETLDDIVFHDTATDDPTAKLQSKHTVDPKRTLSDASPDLWKTLYNWLVEPSENHVRLILLAVAEAGTAAARLRVGEGRDVAAALRDLERTARESTSTANVDYYRAFLDLDLTARREFLERVDVIDRAATAVDIQPALERTVRKSVKQHRRPALVKRLQGWWHKRAVAHLDAVARHERDRITAGELEEQLLEIADSLRDENLPIDVLDMPEPSDEEVSKDDRIFIAQLRLVEMGSQRLRKCIYDHNRAFAQRSIWQRDRLLEVGELGRYEAPKAASGSAAESIKGASGKGSLKSTSVASW